MSEDAYGGAYDPTAPEGDSRSSQYVTKRDVRIVAVFLILLIAAGFPIFRILQKRAQRSVCATNLGAVANAISQYAVLHDDRFPPIMRTGPGNQPDLGDSGHPYTWVSDIDELMTKRASFLCPAADEKDVTFVEGIHKLIPTTYGMYEPYGGYLRTIIPNPDQTVLISETSNLGSGSTYDPLPYKGGADGFVIGWNDSNDIPDDKSVAATRLAFMGTESGIFKADGEARHEDRIHALNCDGAMIFIKPVEARIKISRGLPSGLWQAPPISGVHGTVH